MWRLNHHFSAGVFGQVCLIAGLIISRDANGMPDAANLS